MKHVKLRVFSIHQQLNYLNEMFKLFVKLVQK
ncbi:hypothetical protein VINI7043_23957 [Vibrio nigripulchritudo ATCC 27043]|nr:hypothetical protein VINI7043_23957 [Vibrio nigripulchritudo ATCC 27043]